MSQAKVALVTAAGSGMGAAIARKLAATGYQVAFFGQKTYNGVAILSKVSASEPVMAIPDFDDPQKRVLAATINGVRVVCLYVPNGQSVGSDKYQYKLAWLQATTTWLKNELAAPLGRPGRTVTVMRRALRPSIKPLRV